MRALVVGSGGREHAIVVALAASEKLERVFVAPGNGGTAQMRGKVTNVAVAEKDVAAWAKANGIALVVIGPEAPLVNGVGDAVAAAGVPCFGPSQSAAVIEASKAWSKEFMVRHSLRTAAFRNFARGEVEAAVAWARAAAFDVVVKASGLAAGKGVLVPRRGDPDAAEEAVRELCAQTADPASDVIVVEERMDGEEISLLAWSDGARCVCMPPAQDHKRAHDGDRGLNTGGMGAYAPSPLISPAELREAEAMMQRAVEGLAQEGRPFVGVLYGGFMLTKAGPSLLEFNARFGDPETQVLLPLLKSDCFEVMLACAEGAVARAAIEYRDAGAATVVVASKGYPKAYAKGHVIGGLDKVADVPGCFCYHAGTALNDAGDIVTSGGRVVAVTAVAPDLKSALTAAYVGAARVEFSGAFYRGDVGRRCTDAPVRVGVLGSTRGSSLESVLAAMIHTTRPGDDDDDHNAAASSKGGLLDASVVAVFSNTPDAGILDRARAHGVATVGCLAKVAGETRSAYDDRLTEALERAGVEVVLLVGWMKILSPGFTRTWKGRCFNVHPSLLPLFAGGMDLEVHKAVIAAGHVESGCTVHHVTDEVDGGAVVVQLDCPVLAGDTPEALKARVQALEGKALCEAIRRFGDGSCGARFAWPRSLPLLKQAGSGGHSNKKTSVLTYRMAGVDIDAGDALVRKIKPMTEATKVPGAEGSIGGFGAVFDLNAAGFGGDDVLLVSGADGVGTKLRAAADASAATLRRFEGNLGVDLVAMCVNDIVCAGAQPLYFLDYYASAKLDVDRCAALVAGVAAGCVESGCALAGGETAEMPGLYAAGDYDVAGFAVGAVRKADVLPRTDRMRAGDALVALPSSGVHSNGFSLVRKALARLGPKAADALLAGPFGDDAAADDAAAASSSSSSFADALLAPTRLFVKPVLAVMKLPAKPLLGLAHITGGGLTENLPRALPDTLQARVQPFALPALFKWLKQACGDLPDPELLRTFNCGIGMVLVVQAANANDVLETLKVNGEPNAFLCGTLVDRPTDAPRFVLDGALL